MALRLFTLLILTASGSAAAQEAVHPGYPNVDRAVEIGPGESVHLLSRILVDRAPGMRAVRRLEFHYRTTIPAGSSAARAAQAERAAQVFGAKAADAGARTLAIAICDTEGCAKRDEPPRVWYLFEQKAGNVWKPVKP